MMNAPAARKPAEYQLLITWRDFQRALYAPPAETFLPFVWIHRLVRAALHDVAFALGISVGVLFPALALSLIGLVILSYIAVLRRTVIQEQCRNLIAEYGEGASSGVCLVVHDATVAYLSFMTLFYFFQIILQSPGIVSINGSQESKEAVQVPTSNNNIIATRQTDEARNNLYPIPHPTYCRHCQHMKPPRSHHCSTCGVCVLQYDHHCIWLGTCIGHSNYRSFVGLLFFLALSSWFGVFVLFRHVYEQIQQYGWTWTYHKGVGLLDLPPLLELVQIMGSCPHNAEQCTAVVVAVVYPLLCGVGLITVIFGGQHVYYMAHAHTTLEHRVVMEHHLQWRDACSSSRGSKDGSFESKDDNAVASMKPRFTNPFDQGWHRNILQVIGRRWWLFFLPVPLAAPPPLLPSETSSSGLHTAEKRPDQESSKPQSSASSSGNSLHVAPIPLGIQADFPAQAPPLGSKTSTNSLADGAEILSLKSRNNDVNATGRCASEDDESLSDGSHSTNAQDWMPSQRCLSEDHPMSAVGLDVLLEQRKIVGGLGHNMVRIEGLRQNMVAIEEVYDGIHTGTVLGSGISGVVRLVTHKMTGYKYAVKILDLELIDSEDALDQLQEEIFNMCQLDHPNIVRLHEIYENRSNIYLVQELCLGGDLLNRLGEQTEDRFPEAKCACFVKQILSAVGYMHARGIMHRDLKMENLLLSSKAEDSALKVVDFGFSKRFIRGDIQREPLGTPYTVAPEVIKRRYNERCDLWSVGVILFSLFSGEPPFGTSDSPEALMTLRANILSGSFQFEPLDIWKTVSSSAKSFICALLQTDPKKRLTVQQALKHPWLQEWTAPSPKLRVDNSALSPNLVQSLVNFKALSSTQQVFRKVLSLTLQTEQMEAFRQEFQACDADGTGMVSLAALKQVLSGPHTSLTEEEAEEIFDTMCRRKTETRIQWHEFVAAALSLCQIDERNLRLAFARLDSDHKGCIAKSDIANATGDSNFLSEDDATNSWKGCLDFDSFISDVILMG